MKVKLWEEEVVNLEKSFQAEREKDKEDHKQQLATEYQKSRQAAEVRIIWGHSDMAYL